MDRTLTLPYVGVDADGGLHEARSLDLLLASMTLAEVTQ